MNGTPRMFQSASAYLQSLGPSELAYPLAAAALAIVSLTCVRRPFVNLAIAISYLVIANSGIYVLGLAASAAVSALLIANCFVGTLLVSRFRMSLPRSVLLPVGLACLFALVGTVHGLAQGNPVVLVLGDLYQILEIASLFVLTYLLVGSERQFRTVVVVLVVATIAASLLQTIDLLLDANYLPGLEGVGKRIINMFSPTAFVILLAASLSARRGLMPWLLAALAVVEGYLIFGFARGLWVAAAASVALLLLLLGGTQRWRALALAGTCAVGAVAAIFGAGFGNVFINRVSVGIAAASDVSRAETVKTLQVMAAGTPEGPAVRNVPPQEAALDPAQKAAFPILATRRMLEHVLLLPRIAEHPILGKGLGATYPILGDAVLGGPKGQEISFHFLHDLYLEVVYRLGIPALIVLVAILCLYFRRAIANLRALPAESGLVPVFASLIAVVFGDAVLSLSSPVFLNHPMAGVSGCIMAMTLTAFRPQLD